jgi:hypothetical protein
MAREPTFLEAVSLEIASYYQPSTEGADMATLALATQGT